MDSPHLSELICRDLRDRKCVGRENFQTENSRVKKECVFNVTPVLRRKITAEMHCLSPILSRPVTQRQRAAASALVGLPTSAALSGRATRLLERPERSRPTLHIRTRPPAEPINARRLNPPTNQRLVLGCLLACIAGIRVRHWQLAGCNSGPREDR